MFTGEELRNGRKLQSYNGFNYRRMAFIGDWAIIIYTFENEELEVVMLKLSDSNPRAWSSSYIPFAALQPTYLYDSCGILHDDNTLRLSIKEINTAVVIFLGSQKHTVNHKIYLSPLKLEDANNLITTVMLSHL